ncbi:MAG: protein translocase subunit SecD [Acidobacteria bacterium]|nr:MAG: protein translocase subunit SecD [Acidobacteriota bacterium]
MRKNLRWKLLFIAVVTLACIAGFAGFPPKLANMKERIHLGLDLRGGIHMILQVVTDDAVNMETDQAVERIKEELRLRQISFSEVRKRDFKHIEIREVDPQKTSETRALIDENFQYWDRSTLPEVPNSYLLTLRSSVEQQIRASSVQQAIQTIRNRVDQLGVTEPIIQEHGVASEYQILVQLPGVDDPSRVKDIIKSTALLELKIVEPGYGPFPSREAALSQFNGSVPEGKELLPSVRRLNDPSQSGEEWYLVNKVAAITGKDLRTARPTSDEFGKPIVSFNLTVDGAARFGRVTEENVGKALAIILDGKVKSAPRINGRITDSGQITGSFTLEEANDLALVLRSGALPARMIYLEERTVGASLGADSIRHGVLASLVGLAIVILFMLFYYKLSGVNAIVALILNLIILVASLAYIQATLTLPGIAGVVLLIGMAVDSNVLIFERIREELWGGKNVVSAVNTGFSKAFVTIIDTHVTTVVSVLFLFIFGTGPVKGFAVVLFWGLLANLFTSVFVSKVLFDYVLSGSPRYEKLSI